MNLLIVIIRSSELGDSAYCQEQLSQIGQVTELTEEAFLMLTEHSATEVRDLIKARVLPSRIFVTKVAHGAAWANINTANATVKEWYQLAE